jgi:hypothetical protein
MGKQEFRDSGKECFDIRGKVLFLVPRRTMTTMIKAKPVEQALCGRTSMAHRCDAVQGSAGEGS